jgi:hypothetical protein
MVLVPMPLEHRNNAYHTCANQQLEQSRILDPGNGWNG